MLKALTMTIENKYISISMYKKAYVAVLSAIGRLKQNINKWREASEKAYILDVVEKRFFFLKECPR